MTPCPRNLTPSEAAAQLGVSIKALRLYERHGLIDPGRSRAGWRVFTPEDLGRAAEVVSLRTLGLSLKQIGRALAGDPRDLDGALAIQESRLAAQSQQIASNLARLARMRSELDRGRIPLAAELAALTRGGRRMSVAFDLPWPWDGEPFALNDIRPLTYLTGPLGSGKTRLAMRLAQEVPNAEFLGLERLDREPVSPSGGVAAALAWLVDEGAQPSDALILLLSALDDGDSDLIVVDMIEQGLDQATQEALAAFLRLRSFEDARSLVLLTRSSSILDLDAVGPNEAIIYCPANHGPPLQVAARFGSPGYEAVATCLASPDVRARTAGIIAMRGSGAAMAS